MIKTSVCPTCKKEFPSYNKGGIRGYTKYCSVKCKGKGQRGIVSPKKGIKTGFCWNKGLTKENSESVMKYAIKKIGDKNPMWKGGKDNTSYLHRVVYKENRLQKICQKCGSTKFVDIHHKDKNTDNNDIKNIMVLCRKCHKQEHLKGYKPKRVKVICEYCGKEKEIYPCEAKRFRFCSHKCSGSHMNKMRWS